MNEIMSTIRDMRGVKTGERGASPSPLRVDERVDHTDIHLNYVDQYKAELIFRRVRYSDVSSGRNPKP
jgi:hypothetical protein